jgi:hypothetical protein
MIMATEYDRYGRAKFDPAIHYNHLKPWTTTDEKYLIDNYEFDGPEELSFALGRTVYTIGHRVWHLRKRGLMPRATVRWHRRSGQQD